MTEHSDERPVVLVTGSAGLIGSGLMARLTEDYRPVGLDIAEPDHLPEEADWIACDLTDDGSVQQALAELARRHGDRVTSVIHLAAYYDFSGEPSPLYRQLTVEGTRRLLREVKKLETEQFVFASSLLVMKPVEEEENRLTEEAPTEAEWDYPRSKLEAEKAIRREHGEVPAVILRIAGVYDQFCHSLPIGQHVRRIYEKELESYMFPGVAEHGQPFIHLEDLIDCFMQTIERRKKLHNEEVFLIAEPEVMSHAELQDTLGDLIHGKEWPTIRIPKMVAKAGAWVKNKLTPEEAFIKPWMVDLADDHYPVRIQHARERLHWEPQHRLRDELPAIMGTLKLNPRRWYAENNLPVPENLEEFATESVEDQTAE